MQTPRWAGAILSATFLLGGVAESYAQSEPPPYDPAIDVQLFEYAIGPRTFLTVSDGAIADEDQLGLDVLLTYLTNPFTIYNVDPQRDEITGERTQVVRSLLAGELSGVYGLSDRLQLGVALPLIFSMTGSGLDPSTAMGVDGGLQATGLGDLRAEVKTQLYKSAAMSMAGAGMITLPTSFAAGGSDFIGDDLPSLRARLATQWRNPNGTLSLGANLGVLVRKPREIYSSTIGQQLIYGAAGAMKLGERIGAIAEVFGRTGLTSLDLDASPLEVSGALKVQANRSVSVLLGGGSGLVRGIGAPALRVFFSVGWAPDYRDTDGDGIPNLRDRCPLLAEDRDGFEDDDGCPDDDNDGDHREDSVDQCPNDAEDIDGFEDDDGCPELDNDKDGINDIDDRCILEAEDGIGKFTKDGCPASKSDSDDDSVNDAEDRCIDEAEDADEFEDWDGCPDLDNDKDGIPDAADKCPLCAEDIDGFEDDDGCPELDNDRDGIADTDDRCPLEAETLNGVNDDDGCPDRGGKVLAELDGDILNLGEEIRFNRSDRLRTDSRNAIDQAAVIMKLHPEVTKWLVVVAAPKQRGGDDATREKSQRWANVIKAQLLIRGVDSDRIDTLAAVSDTPRTGIRAMERAEETGAFQCPAGMEAVPREPGAAPVPAAAATVAEPAAEPAVTAAEPAVTAAEPAVTAAEPAAASAELPIELMPFAGVVKEIDFKRNSANMSRRSKKTLDKIAELMAAHPTVKLEIGTHTDSRKGPEKSLVLTQSQADAVVEYLVKKGISVDRLKGVGYGMDKPIGDNNRSKGRSENRRVELTFTVQ